MTEGWYSKGRIVLPDEIQERLGITHGVEVKIYEEDGTQSLIVGGLFLVDTGCVEISLIDRCRFAVNRLVEDILEVYCWPFPVLALRL